MSNPNPDLKYLIALSQIKGLGPVSLKKPTDHFSDYKKAFRGTFLKLFAFICKGGRIYTEVSNGRNFTKKGQNYVSTRVT